MVKKLIESDDFDPIEGEYEDVSVIQGDLDQQLNEIISEFGGGEGDQEYTLRLYRAKEGKGGKLAYLFECSYTDLPILDRLRDEYDGGTFEVRVLVNGKIYTRRKCLVEAPIKRHLQVQPNNSEGLISVMTTGFSRLGELMLQNQQNQQKPEGLKDILENMVLMKQIMGDPAPPVNPLEQMKGILEIQKMIGGDTNGAETNVNDVLLSLAETVLPKLAENMGESEVPAPSSENTPVVRERPERQSPMKMQLVYLCSKAKANKDPSLYAELVLDNVKDDDLDSLVDFVCSENSIDRMIALHKPVGDYKDWFKKLGEEILKQVEEVEEKQEIIPLTDTEKTPNSVIDADKPENNSDAISDPKRVTGNETCDENDEVINQSGKKESSG